MKPSIHKRKQIKELKKRAYRLYKKGLSTRQIGKKLERSHQWAADAIKHH